MATQLPIPECAPRRPVSPYGVHKKIAEDLCRSYGRTFGVRVAMVRIFSAYGPELRKQLLWDACRKARGGERRFGGTGQETRDWIAIEDVAALLLREVEMASPDAPVVNGATGEDVAIRQVVGFVYDAVGAPAAPVFSGVGRAGDLERYAGDPARARGWGREPEHGWRDGMRDYVRWFEGVSA